MVLLTYPHDPKEIMDQIALQTLKDGVKKFEMQQAVLLRRFKTLYYFIIWIGSNKKHLTKCEILK